jgi:xylulokinase
VLENKEPGAQLKGVSFNTHHAGHVIRAAQEGIVFALQYGMEVMKEMGMEIKTVKAGHANMFLSEVFASAFTNTSGCSLELFNTDGAVGAARGAAYGAGIFKTREECFRGMVRVRDHEPQTDLLDAYGNAYAKWRGALVY